MNKEYLELLASEGEIQGGAEPVSEPTVEPVSEPTAEQNGGEVQAEPTIEKYTIDGEEYTLEDIKQWKLGNMRQSDYTKKTTEVARQREELKEAVELFEYLKSKPELVQRMLEAEKEGEGTYNKDLEYIKEKNDPIRRELNDLKHKYYMSEVEKELNGILAKDSRVSDIELLDLAQKNQCTVEMAYNYWKGLNHDRLLNESIKEQKEKIANEIKTNNGTTKTLISKGDKNNLSGSYGLSDLEMSYADKLNMTYEEYAKYKTN